MLAILLSTYFWMLSDKWPSFFLENPPSLGYRGGFCLLSLMHFNYIYLSSLSITVNTAEVQPEYVRYRIRSTLFFYIFLLS